MLMGRLVMPCLAIVLLMGQGRAAEPVRMGCGIMTFDTVPGWGLDEQGTSCLLYTSDAADE